MNRAERRLVRRERIVPRCAHPGRRGEPAQRMGVNPMYTDIGTDAVERAERQGVHHRELQCKIRRLEYDCERRHADLYLPPLNCTDMSGTIHMVRQLDPAVRFIQTWAGYGRDTAYECDGELWYAIRPGERDRFGAGIRVEALERRLVQRQEVTG